MTIHGVMLDSREPDWVQRLTFGGAPVVVTALDAGDLWASCADGTLLVVERKTPNDLLGSIRDGRLLDQMTRLHERSRWAYLVITGALVHTQAGRVIAENRVTGWDWHAVQGALLSVQEMGVQVISCTGDGDYAATVERLARRDRAAVKVIDPPTAPRIMTTGEVILTALPGVGLERAQALLAEFDGQVAWALAWLTQFKTISHVAGIGDGTKTNVRHALRLGPGEELQINNGPDFGYSAARGVDMTTQTPERVTA